MGHKKQLKECYLPQTSKQEDDWPCPSAVCLCSCLQCLPAVTTTPDVPLLLVAPVTGYAAGAVDDASTFQLAAQVLPLCSGEHGVGQVEKLAVYY